MIRSTITVFLVLALAGPAWGGGLPNDPQLVLDLREGSWRMHMGWKTPEIIDDQGNLKKLWWEKTRQNQNPGPVAVRRSWVPPKDWKEPGFDDTYWARARGRVILPQPNRGGKLRSPGNPADWNLICLRGRFRVTDPKRVMLPRVYLHYHGGAVIYVNGEELQRGHLPKGEIEPDTLADPYAKETYVRPDGRLYTLGEENQRDFADFKDRIAKRVRRIPPKGWLDSVAIPNKMLKKGVNVIAIEVHRAPINEVAVTGKEVPGGWKFGYQQWPHAGIVMAKVTVGSPTGLIQNVAPNEGLHVSNEHPWETLYAYDYSHPQPSIRPISLFGAKNGSYSGRLLVSSREDVIGLKVTGTGLTHADGKGKIDSVRIRFAEPASPPVSHRRWPRFDRLLDKVPDVVKAVPMKIHGRKLQPIPTVAVPVWVTVDVPKDAAPGEYSGSVTVEAQYADPLEVPVHLAVCDWALPDTKDFKLNHTMFQSPDSVALYYGIEPWSDEHFERIAKSFRIADQMGSRLIPLSLIIGAPNLQTRESMVRWIPQKDGSYEYDFTVVEKYLDCFQEAVGKPRIIVVYNGGFEGRTNEAKPPDVTTLDPKTGKLGRLTAPNYGTKEYTEFWRPVLHELRARLKKRGWYDVAAIGHISYCWAPTKETAASIKSIWPDGRWMSSCHGYRSRFGGLPVLCNEWIWGCGRMYDPDSESPRYNVYPRPWRKRRSGHRQYDQYISRGYDENNLLAQSHSYPERQMQRDLHGLGRLGADFWPILNPKSNSRRRQFYYLTDGYAGLGIQTTNIAMTGPGPDGAVWTERGEVFREGVQVAETIVYVRDAIDEKKVTGELAKRAEELLLDRARHMLRQGIGRPNRDRARISGGARERNDKLYAIAAEITKQAAGE
ncbi:MAG: hypothetical protein R6V58_06060 [Planctomycetota bacterium]